MDCGELSFSLLLMHHIFSGTGLKPGTDYEMDGKTDRVNLRFVALQVVGRAFTVAWFNISTGHQYVHANFSSDASVREHYR